MKLLKNSLTTLLLSVFILGLVSSVQAQDKRAAVKTYNKALELAQSGDYQQAINVFNQAISKAKKLGEEGQDILSRSQSKLPQVHYQLALKKYKTFQSDKTLANLEATIDQFRTTKEVAEKYGESQYAKKAAGIVTQLLYNKAVVQYQQNDLKASLATLDEVIQRDPNYAKAYYQKGIVIKNMDSKNLEQAIAQFDKAIEVGQKTNDSQIVSTAKDAARKELVYRGFKAIESKNFNRAIELLNRALTYDSTSANAYFRLAQAYNKTQDWQKAVSSAQKGIKYETGGKTEKAKIYFELATAYQGLGQKEKACNAFENAAYGSFKAPAQHQMEYELKCESTTN